MTDRVFAGQQGRRRGDPQKLGDVVNRLMSTRGYARIVSRDHLLDTWTTAAGSLARDSLPGNVKRSVLEVVVRNSAVLQELTFRKRQLLKDIGQLMPEQTIRDLRFVIGHVD